MLMIFCKSKNLEHQKDIVTLDKSDWDDYGYRTQFYVTYYDENLERHDLGTIKIGFIGQANSEQTANALPDNFPHLKDNYFSLGQSSEFYERIIALPKRKGFEILKKLRDIAFNKSIFNSVMEEHVLYSSLMRFTSSTTIKNQFTRILEGGVTYESFDFSYQKSPQRSGTSTRFDFSVKIDSKPPTHMHVLIGRNGTGKTKLLNSMITSLVHNNNESGAFFEKRNTHSPLIGSNYFSGVISVSFSAFDKFVPPQDQPDSAKGLRYHHIGLKQIVDDELQPKSDKTLETELLEAIETCLNQEDKRTLLLDAIKTLESDDNFKQIGLVELIESRYDRKTVPDFKKIYKEMSSGHAIVLQSLSRLIAYIEEKSLVMMDEPESHLHPPLLSAFTRAISNILAERNAIALIATHSPVILQEVPKNCVWKLYRIDDEIKAERPLDETFGENLGVLTSEIFSLEVSASGFHNLLRKSVEDNSKTYNQIIDEYNDQIGFEGRSILRNLIATRGKGGNR
ncbi:MULTISPECIES: AAA family ATPase [Pseudomonas]|uniref:AAA family ATPase n=1 Tax=Pseudomonas TaxID=286 RepID=UPI0009458A9D|nr:MULTISPECIES: AAA family ATPase [Pseudomonas]